MIKKIIKKLILEWQINRIDQEITMQKMHVKVRKDLQNEGKLSPRETTELEIAESKLEQLLFSIEAKKLEVEKL